MKCLLIVILLAPLTSFAQAPTGTIAGQIRGPDGKTIQGIRIGAATVDEDAASASLASVARSDEDGRFRLEGIPPGQYWIVAGALASPTYYPGTDQKASAKTIMVAARTVVDGIDFSLVTPLSGMSNFVVDGNITDPRRGPMIKGRFVLEDGDPLPLPAIARVRYGRTFGVWVSSDGTFSIPARTADYVSVEVQGAGPFGNFYIKSMTYDDLDLLESPLVVAGVPDEVVITLARGARISGVIHTESGSPADVTVYLISDIPFTDRPDLLRLATTDAQGRFEMNGVAPGRYRLSSQNDLEEGRATVAIEGGRDSTKMRLTFSADRGLTRAQ